jgi:hypothetical protein
MQSESLNDHTDGMSRTEIDFSDEIVAKAIPKTSTQTRDRAEVF